MKQIISNNKKHIKILHYLLIVFASIFLFAGSPTSLSTRSMITGWELGHILLFALLGIILLKDIKWLKKKTFVYKFIILITLTIVIGIIIEFLQYGIDRTPDITDIWRNIIGILLPLGFTKDSINIANYQKYIIRFFIVFLVLIEVKPLFISLSDEYLAYKNFPVIADFETPFELSRWHGDSKYKIVNDIVKHGNASLKTTLNTSKYSGVSIDYFPSDWSNYSYLKFNVFNSTDELLKFTTRIHDDFHTNKYSDRYNKRFTAKPGWNEYSIKIQDILNAPKTRKMDIVCIKNIAVFATKLPEPKIVYLDYFRLE